MHTRRIALLCTLLALVVGLLAAPANASQPITLSEYRLSQTTMDTLRSQWTDRVLAEHAEGAWAPMRMDLDDEQLALMGLPPKDVLLSRRYPTPTMLEADGTATPVPLPTVATFAGTGFFGIRPGAWLLLMSGNSIGWCSAAHVYGAPGSYAISTAGHCGKAGDVATVIAAFGNQAGVLNPVLLDFGTFKSSRDGGVGNDWALISVASQYQSLVTPTMAFWGGPRGMYTATGSVASVKFPRNGLIPQVTVTPDPFLAQDLVHYGHGTGVGPGGTPRSAVATHWGSTHYMFFGAISPGDSGSGANTLTGDTVGATMEAAGIMTHLYVDPLMRLGLGVMAGTRATAVSGTLANGQIVPYPVPVSGLP